MLTYVVVALIVAAVLGLAALFLFTDCEECKECQDTCNCPLPEQTQKTNEKDNKLQEILDSMPEELFAATPTTAKTKRTNKKKVDKTPKAKKAVKKSDKKKPTK